MMNLLLNWFTGPYHPFAFPPRRGSPGPETWRTTRSSPCATVRLPAIPCASSLESSGSCTRFFQAQIHHPCCSGEPGSSRRLFSEFWVSFKETVLGMKEHTLASSMRVRTTYTLKTVLVLGSPVVEVYSGATQPHPCRDAMPVLHV